MSRRSLARAVRNPLEMLGPFDGRQMRLTGDQARSAAVRQEAPGPPDNHDEPVGEADEKDDVDAEPHSPSGEAAHLAEPTEPAYVGHARQAFDHRYVATVSVSERLGRLAEYTPPDRVRCVIAFLDRGRRNSRHTLPALQLRDREEIGRAHV